MEYFDIHNHILPGVDDGAETKEEAMKMVEIAFHEGTRKMLLTPHYVRGKNSYTKEELRNKFEELKTEAEKQYQDMEFYLGNEILYEDGIVEDLKNGLIQTLNDTKYVLVEFNIRIPYNQMYEAVRKLINARFRPIIAHVERYHCLTKHIDRLDELIGMETYFQMNISSVYGGMLDEKARWCKKLIKEGYITFFGTDAHDLENRAPYIKDYTEWIRKKCGEDFLEEIFRKNAEKMVANRYITE